MSFLSLESVTSLKVICDYSGSQQDGRPQQWNSICPAQNRCKQCVWTGCCRHPWANSLQVSCAVGLLPHKEMLSFLAVQTNVFAKRCCRQSLPPHLKHKQKSEVILNRKEPKRKSLTISGNIFVVATCGRLWFLLGKTAFRFYFYLYFGAYGSSNDVFFW